MAKSSFSGVCTASAKPDSPVSRGPALSSILTATTIDEIGQGGKRYSIRRCALHVKSRQLQRTSLHEISNAFPVARRHSQSPRSPEVHRKAGPRRLKLSICSDFSRPCQRHTIGFGKARLILLAAALRYAEQSRPTHLATTRTKLLHDSFTNTVSHLEYITKAHLTVTLIVTTT